MNTLLMILSISNPCTARPHAAITMMQHGRTYTQTQITKPVYVTLIQTQCTHT